MLICLPECIDHDFTLSRRDNIAVRDTKNKETLSATWSNKGENKRARNLVETIVSLSPGSAVTAIGGDMLLKVSEAHVFFNLWNQSSGSNNTNTILLITLLWE